MRRFIRFDKKDNVAVVLDDIVKGETVVVEELELTAGEYIPYGHKIALADLNKGDTVVKYGEPVARCIADIHKGDWVHVHNVESIRGLGR